MLPPLTVVIWGYICWIYKRKLYFSCIWAWETISHCTCFKSIFFSRCCWFLQFICYLLLVEIIMLFVLGDVSCGLVWLAYNPVYVCVIKSFNNLCLVLFNKDIPYKVQIMKNILVYMLISIFLIMFLNITLSSSPSYSEHYVCYEHWNLCWFFLDVKPIVSLDLFSFTESKFMI